MNANASVIVNVNVKLLPRPPRTVNTWPAGPFGQFVYLLCRVNYDGALASVVGTFQATTKTYANFPCVSVCPCVSTMNIQSNLTEPI